MRPLFQQRTKNLEGIFYEINYRTPQFLRLSLEEFEHIHTLVEPFIKKMDTHWRTAITSKERLAITLRYLATGDSYSSLQYTFHVSKQTISTIIPEVCDAIVRALKDMVQVNYYELYYLYYFYYLVKYFKLQIFNLYFLFIYFHN